MSTDCPGLPSTAGAYSLNIQFRPLSQLAYLTAYPTGTTMPVVSTIVGNPAGWTTNAAIVPTGTSGQIDIYCQYAGRVVIDVNGYYGPQSVVTSLNTKTGDVTLAQGSNVTITPSGNTLTIAATGGPGGVLPVGTTGQTLYHNGSAWTASSALTNNGTNVGISHNLLLPATTTAGSAGVLFLGSDRFLHNYGPANAGNTFVGQQAGNFTTTFGANTGIGYESLFSDTTGADNTGIGYQSLSSNTNGNDNTASGAGSLPNNSSGSYNTADGAGALYQNTSGISNTALGYRSLATNTTAGQNTAVGVETLLLQSYSNSNTQWSGYNTAVGFQALHSNQPTSTTTGIQNTAIGSSALYSNITGRENTASGVDSLRFNTTGGDNTASGIWSLRNNTTGNENTASGSYSLAHNTTADGNTAFGSSALQSQSYNNSNMEWSSYNTAVGYEALDSNQPTSTSNGVQNTAVGALALAYNTTGLENTAIGANVGSRDVTISAYDTGTATFVHSRTGSFNTFVGYGTGATVDPVGNCTAVGVDAYCTGDNQVRLGNVYVNSIGGQVGWSGLSDIRAKRDVRDLDFGLDFVLQLRPVAYTLKNGNGKTDMGFVAQDIEALLGDGYNVLGIGGDAERTLSLRHTDLIAPLVKAVQEQQVQIEALKAELAGREAERAQLRALLERVATLEAGARLERSQP